MKKVLLPSGLVIAILAGLWALAYWFVGFDPDFALGLLRNAALRLRGGTSFHDIVIEEKSRTGQFTGFDKTLYYHGLDKPTSIAFAPDGTLFVLESGGSIVTLKDTDGDGIADQRGLFTSGFDSPMGIAFKDELVYIASKGKVSVLRDSDRDGLADEVRDIVTGLPVGRHQTDSLAFGPDGKLYISQGSRSDRGEFPIHPLEGSILRANPDGSGLEVYARGLRNPWDLAFHPETGELFATDNGQDVPPKGVPDELNLIIQGGDYGWPNCWGKNLGPDCKLTDIPSIEDLEEHSSADGLVFYTGDQFPPEYKNNLFITLWGANSQDPDIGREIIRVVLAKTGSTYSVQVSTFARSLGNPLDITIGPDGTLYVSDFSRGQIVRIYARYG